MTILDERPPPPASSPPPPEPDTATEPDGLGAAAPVRQQGGAEAVLRALVVLLVALVAAVAIWKAFDQIATPAMYRTRQHHLAADFAEQRAGLAPGQAAAVLQIPGIGANLVVVEGSGARHLRDGPGHRPETPVPGKRGNSVIEGHRTRWGGPFGDLSKLVPKTRIIAINRSGVPAEYRVTTVKRVKRADLPRYLAPSRDYRITLVTHAGGSLSEDRLVVQARAGTSIRRPRQDELPATDPPASSPVPALALGSLGVLGAVLAWFRLRTDHRGSSVLLVVVPLGALALLAFLMAVDVALPPLL